MYEYSEECLSSLQFANRCRNVQNQPRVNYIGNTPQDKDRKIKRLSEELAILTRRLKSRGAADVEKVQNILKALGIQATMNEDGSVELPDGRKIGTEGLLSSEDELLQDVGLDGELRSGGYMGGFGKGGARGRPALSNDPMERLTDSLKAEITILNNKVQEKKKQVCKLCYTVLYHKHIILMMNVCSFACRLTSSD